MAPHLTAFTLADWERDGLKAALKKAGLPSEDVEAPNRLFWRFETDDLVPVGFGGLEIRGADALLRSVVTLPPVRTRGVGAAIVAILEVEARALGCRTIWLLTTTAAEFFGDLGYRQCERATVPPAIRTTAEFATLCPASATVMTKSLA
jgi:N-acetylglutamate synthase-like GNAT family acetyltransferase